MTSISVWTVTVAILSSGLLSVLLTQWLTRGAEHRKWLRHERYVAFARLLTAADSAKNEAAYVNALFEGAQDIPLLLSKNKEKLDKLTEDEVEGTGGPFDELKKSLMKEAGRDPGTIISKGGQMMLELDNTLAGIMLLASENVTESATNLVTAAKDLMTAMYPLGDEDIKTCSRNYCDAQESFVNATQKDLK